MIYLKTPELEDCWYEKKLNEDKDTMSYNAGWDVSYFGYNYNDGTILFPKERWKIKYDDRKNNNKYFKYIVYNNEYAGYVNYQKSDDKYTCGIVIDAKKRGKGIGKEGLRLMLLDFFKKHPEEKLYDDFETTRKDKNIFYSLGFKKDKEYAAKRFNKDVKIEIVVIDRKHFRTKFKSN